MKLKLTAIVFGILSFGFFSCSENAENNLREDASQIDLGWEIVDSLDFEYLGDPVLGDVNVAANRALFYNYVDQNIILTDLGGNIINEFKKTEDTPDSYGFLMELPGFFNDQSILILGLSGVFIYDLESNLIKKIDHPEAVGMAAFMAKVGKTIKSTSFDGKDYILSKSIRNNESFPGEQKFYEEFTGLELIDVEAGTGVGIVPFPEGSVFLNGMGYYMSDYEPAYAAEGKKLYAVLGGEPILHVMTLNNEGASLDTLVNLEIPGFGELEGKELSSFSEGSVMVTGSTPAIRDIHLVDGKILLPYYAGMDPGKMEELMGIFESGDQELAENMYEQFEKEVIKGVLVYDSKTLEYQGEIKMTEKLPNVTFASDGGFLWMQRPMSKEVEEDFRRVYKVKITEK